MLDALSKDVTVAESKGGHVCYVWLFVIHTTNPWRPAVRIRTYVPTLRDEMVLA